MKTNLTNFSLTSSAKMQQRTTMASFGYVLWMLVLLLGGGVFEVKAATDCNAVTEIPVAECQELLNLYNSTSGPNWISNTDWNVTNTPCSWYGVSCSGGHVTELDLNSNDLNGPVPNFGNLPSLTVLYFYNNQLTGSIPNFNLPNLTELSLADNQLDGSLPDFSNLPNLTGLHLSGNQLSGPIPDFSNRPNLTYLYLMNNQLSGPIPNFNNLPNLTFLYLDRNQLSGPIPNFSNLPSLTGLLLYENQLSGPIPEFSNLSNLTFLFLMNNHLNGTIPNLDWSSFNLFSLTNNCGLIAYDAAQETVLNDKDPEWQTRNTNCPTDCNTVTEIPVAECQDLLNLYNTTNGPNWLNKTGWNATNTPCSWYGVSCSGGHVTQLGLNDNQLVGPLPNFSNLPSLTSLLLYNNQLSGLVHNFNNLPNLTMLHLNGNQLNGSVPDFGNLPNLTALVLGNNQLTETIPNFSNLPNLVWLRLAYNQLTGTIPDFSNLPKLELLNLSYNQLSGPILDFSNLPNLKTLNFIGNQLSGPIPDFSNLPKLEYLDLFENQLNGPIPNFSNLPNLAYLYLNNNQLNGTVPNLNWSSFSYVTLYNNCGLVAYDAAQEATLNSKDPTWQTRNPSCPVVTLTVTKTGNGTITSTPAGLTCGDDCTEDYASGTTITLTATPDVGYAFLEWTEDCGGTTATTTVTMDAAKNCTATFVPVVETNLELTLTPSPIRTDSQMGTTPLQIAITGCNDSIYWKAQTQTGGYITNLLVTPTEGHGNATVTLSYRKPSVMSPRKGQAKIIVTAYCGTSTTVLSSVEKKVTIR